ncbi:MAG: hypothetical protein ACD_7C00142G0007 [uncultured bacterium]|nr:MAG: hypothetical protein ACD_7C00142G0007 [uncultured bacterium]KKP67747.1 MAG: hypothetical protein UR66_C0011G0023 [Candidatus Moranbacteria bacterium GW2011_GWE1_35_17]KKP73083.1 MAG: hypothetical protein UR65_C0008G0005 [Candidatus Moranbacteria bacterium GW2011_GWE2_35_164]KKP81645.1 MAG: hypothetical protein UR82_C0055G0002 [Candidatus Moranbacteria bacterium GW2011_GWF1_35_5]KKP84835.1 MAG: hypothetical protein UR83_C0010G0004 [Candidatus Moranbacteria bacterium GW2011_GWF2_35_54]HB
MVDVNFHQAAEKDLMINRRKSFLNSTYFIAIILILAVSATYGATILYSNSLVAKKIELDAIKNQEIALIDIQEVNRLDDFQKRLESSMFNLNNKKNPEDIFALVEKLIVKGSFLNSLNYDSVGNKIEMEVVADSFRLAASQILSLKRSDLFEDVKIAESKRDENNQAVFKLEAVFKK